MNSTTARKGKYIRGNAYISMKEIFIKYWESKSVLGFNSSEEITNFTNYDISDSNMRCEVCIKKPVEWHVKKILPTEIITFTCKGLKQTWHNSQRRNIWSMQKIHNEIDRLLLHNNWFRYRIIWKLVFVYSTEIKLSFDKMFWANVYWFWWVSSL